MLLGAAHNSNDCDHDTAAAAAAASPVVPGVKLAVAPSSVVPYRAALADNTRDVRAQSETRLYKFPKLNPDDT
jgi:hypothetical protein